VPLGQYPDPGHVVAHLSDPHLLAGGAKQYGVIDTEAGLRLALARLARLDPVPQALVFTGDLADRAELAAYARLREIVEPAAAEMDAQVVWVMGNHDERAAYSRGLFGEDSEETQDRVYDVDGLRIVSLDTSVPGYHHGELTDAQLSWLADVLSTPAPHGTLLALHHPPIPVPMMRAAEVIELYDQHRLAEVLTGTDVRCILGGHFHYSTYSTFAGIPVSVASATCYTSDPAPLERFVSGVDGHQAVTMVHVYGDRVVHTIVPVDEAPEVSGFPSDVRAQVEALSPDERRELLSRKDSPVYTGEIDVPGHV
jgi:3',5'-cyclic-AMP phosphodiesterase